MERAVLKFFEDCFEGLEDPRASRNQRHPFLMLVGTTLVAALGGMDDFSKIAEFVEAHQEMLAKIFPMPHGAPSHDTYQRLWEAIDAEVFYGCFELFTNMLADAVSDVISLDGKTIRNSGKNKPLHFVSAWCDANSLVLGQVKVDSKSNEITAIPLLLDLLSLSGRVITIDAMGAQRTICEKIVGQEGDYLIALKGNQGGLFEDVKRYFQDPEIRETLASACDHDKGHGRIEKREAFVTDDLEWLQAQHNWPGLKTIACVKSTVQRGDKVSTEERFYISSLPPDPRRINEVARKHWGIENKLHWRLDVAFNEDKCCISNDNAVENLSIVRKWALNVLSKARTKPDQTIKSLMRKNAMSPAHLFKMFNKIFHA